MTHSSHWADLLFTLSTLWASSIQATPSQPNPASKHQTAPDRIQTLWHQGGPFPRGACWLLSTAVPQKRQKRRSPTSPGAPSSACLTLFHTHEIMNKRRAVSCPGVNYDLSNKPIATCLMVFRLSLSFILGRRGQWGWHKGHSLPSLFSCHNLF